MVFRGFSLILVVSVAFLLAAFVLIFFIPISISISISIPILVFLWLSRGHLLVTLLRLLEALDVTAETKESHARSICIQAPFFSNCLDVDL